jgi:alkylated DNA repair dioxygenase AlkB
MIVFRFCLNFFARVIASVSLGAPRTFIMTRDKKVKAPANHKPSDEVQDSKKRKASEDPSEYSTEIGTVDQKTWTLASGSLVVMQGDTQRYWKHEIPKYVVSTYH